MIEWRREHQNPFAAHQDVRIKLVGIGGTGSSVLDRIALDGIDKADLVAVNTDVQSLKSSVASQKVQLGKTLTCGLGAGGDPEVGYAAAMEAEKELLGVMDNVPLLFVCVGLGGGTGSGAAPVIVNLARQQGAFVVVFATLPFEFEGNRRVQQAREALDQIYGAADCVICFENDRLGENILPRAGIHKAFGFAEQTISQSVRAIAGMVNTPGLIEIGFDELLTVMRNHDPRCLFGYGEAEGEARGLEALADALRSPLMDKGRLLTHADSVLVNIMGGEDLTLSEVQKLMTELNQHINENTHVLMGTAIDKRLGAKLSVTLISSLSNEEYMALVDKRTRLQQSQPGGSPASLPGYSTERESMSSAAPPEAPAAPPTTPAQRTGSSRRQAVRNLSSGGSSGSSPESGVSPDDEPAEDDSPQGQKTFTPLFARNHSPENRQDPEPETEPESEPQAEQPEVAAEPETALEPEEDQPRFVEERESPETEEEPEPEFEQVSAEEEPAPEPVSRVFAALEPSGDPGEEAGDFPEFDYREDHGNETPEETAAREAQEREIREALAVEGNGGLQESGEAEPEVEEEFSAEAETEIHPEPEDEEEQPFLTPEPAQRPSETARPRIRIRSTSRDPEPGIDLEADEEPEPEKIFASHERSAGDDREAKRGQFEKYEPTIIDGEDYDIPTFMRRNVKING